MATKLKDMEIPSVDLCRRGANPRADIKLFKSTDSEKGGEKLNTNQTLIDRIAKFLAGELAGETPITKADSVSEVYGTTEALRKSLESIIEDDSLSAVEKHDMMADSLQQFTLEATECMDGWANAQGIMKEDEEDNDFPSAGEEDDDFYEEEEEDEDSDDPDEKVKKGVFDMATIDINKMSPEDKDTLEALAKKYAGDEGGAEEMHPEVRKAIDELAELRKSLELKELEGIAKKYEVLGKKPNELAEKLYDLKKAGEGYYNDFIGLMDEQVKMAENGIFKEVGSNRSGGSDLDATVGEIMKANPSMSRAQAVVKAYETNPGLDPFTGKAK